MHKILLLATLLVTTPGFAADAHVHGQARLAVAIDGGTLTLLLESPTDSLVGFEHAPGNAKERAAVARMKEILERPAELFKPTQAAGCKPARFKLDSALFKPAHSGHKLTHNAHAGHADLDAEFLFQCAQPQHLRGLEVRLFEHFPSLKKLQVEIAGPHGQKAIQLTPSQRTVSW
jgi:hypothetical protein